tara:strand:+ start:458 stop:622 length:165 start_codon:yes stop_codon:yes gene_type:complete
MFIIIEESGNVYSAKNVTDDDLTDCDAGIISIVDTKKGKEFFENEWVELQTWRE